MAGLLLPTSMASLRHRGKDNPTLKQNLYTIIIVLVGKFWNCSYVQTRLITNQEIEKMNKVLIIGASGSLAKYVIDTLKNVSNVQLTLLARSKSRIQSDTTGFTVVEADVMDLDKLKKAVKGQDIVYINLAGDLEAMAKNVVRAMQETGVKRVIAISSIGIYQSPLKPVLVPYRKLADVIEASGLDYTILRPDWFTSGNEIDYELTQKGTPEKGSAISRKSIAAFVSTLIQNPEQRINENLGISKQD
jgi:uncharacterized protein YbjT (DUF2867 family)